MANKRNYNKISTGNAVNEEVVNEEVVVETTAEETAPETLTQVGVVCNCKKLNVRKKPELGSKVVCVLSAADEVEIIDGSDKDFYEIKLNKTKGFCMKKYIEIK